MTKEICPSCGAPYNGKKCRKCFYQPMTPAAVSKGKAVPRKRRSRVKKQKSALRSLVGFLILLALIALLLPILRNWGQELKATAESQSVSQSIHPAVTGK